MLAPLRVGLRKNNNLTKTTPEEIYDMNPPPYLPRHLSRTLWVDFRIQLNPPLSI